ncbi:MAG: alpha-amylase family glycosyl hydrolase, partial [Bacteroidota bacterium]
GEYGGGATGFGTRTQLNSTVAALNSAGVKPIADMVFNHRDGGRAEVNPGVANYIAGYNWSKADGGANPFPYDRMRCIIPLGGSSGNGAGNYYFKVSSASQHSKFFNYEYKIYMQTKTVGWKNLAALSESEPNGGGNCGQGNNTIELGRGMNAFVDASGCTIDEFYLNLQASDFNASGDTLFISFGKRNSDYSDMRIFGIWSGPRSMDIISDLKYQTYTDFSNLPSAQGSMNWNNFKPNNDRTTTLSGDWDGMYFFYDYDQFQTDTKTKLFDWTRWNWNNVGIRGLRMDAVKHFTPEFVGDLLDNLHTNGMDPPIVVGEWYSTNTAELAGWVNSVLSYMDAGTKAAIQPRIFDFALRESLRQSCDAFGYDVRNLFTSSLADAAGLSGYNVVTFVNNHDFRDASGFASLIHNDPMLAYSYLFTNNKLGLPCVFYPDYYGYPNSGATYYPPDRNGFKTKINQLINLHKAYIYGSTSVTYLNKTGSGFSNDAGTANSYILTYQLKGGAGGRDVVVAINFGGSRVQFHQQLNDLPVGTKLTDLLAVSPYQEAVVQTNENGIPNDIWIDIPARSFAIWIQGAANTVTPLPASELQITQVEAGGISMQWRDNATNETGFRIERKANVGGSWSPIQTVLANMTTFTDNTVSGGVHYYYRVFAVNGGLSSAASNTVDLPVDYTWTGTLSSVWNNASNWNLSAVPPFLANITIPGALSNYPVLTQALTEIYSITLQSGASLTIAPGKALTVTGPLTNNSGADKLIIQSDATGTGSLLNSTSGVNGTMQRYIAKRSDNLHGWHFLSAPVDAQAIRPEFVPNPIGSEQAFMKWDEVSKLWINSKDVSGNWAAGFETDFFVGRGYLVNYNSNVTKNFKGLFNVSDITFSGLTKTGSSYSGFHLLGNSYTSAVHWMNGWASQNLSTTAKIWDGMAGSYTDINYDDIIPALQGFMVEADALPASIQISAASRVHDNQAWYKSEESVPLIKLKAQDISGQTSQMSVVKFDAGSTVGYEKEFDSHFLPGYAPQFYSVEGSDHLSTNTLPNLDVQTTIPFDFVKNDGNDYSIEAVKVENIPAHVYLTDLKQNQTQNLSSNPVYSFTSAEGDNPARFLLSFSHMSIDDKTGRRNGIFVYNNILCISNPGESTIELFNMLGQKIVIGKTHDEVLYRLNLALPSGYYIVRMTGSLGVMNQKVFVK